MEEILKKIVLENYGIEFSSNTPISEVVEDSLSKIELLFEIEKGTKCSIPHEEILDIETFGELVEVLEKSLKG